MHRYSVGDASRCYGNVSALVHKPTIYFAEAMAQQQPSNSIPYSKFSRCFALQEKDPVLDTEAEGAGVDRQAAEGYLGQAAVRQASKDLQRQQVPAPPDAAINFVPAVGKAPSDITSCCSLPMV